MSRAAKSPRPTATAQPAYELRAFREGSTETQLEVWQLPAPASPHLKEPRRVAGLGGRNLALVEHRVLRSLKAAGLDPTGLRPAQHRSSPLAEDLALRLGLLFRTLAPMRSRANLVACAEGIEAMGKEEAAYWLGMAMHRKYPRRVLMALRFLLIDPKRG